ncbi:MAG: nuclear transport factor 2 family protein, partial [Granulicella sp.]
QLNKEYIRASLAGDVEWFRAHLADEFVCIESNGSVQFKDEFLQLAAFESDLAEYRLDDVEVRFHGEVALVRASASWATKTGVRGVSRYLDVYVNLQGKWMVVSAQVTRPPQGPCQ